MDMRRYKSILICFLFAVILCSCHTINEQDSIGNVQPSTGENVDSIDGKDELLPSSHSDQMIFVSTEEMIQEILGFEPVHTDIMNCSESDYEDWLDYYSSIVYTNINADDIGYYLSYLDEDDIPELIECVGALEASFVWSWKTPGEFSEMPGTFAYNERSGGFCQKNIFIMRNNMQIIFITVIMTVIPDTKCVSIIMLNLRNHIKCLMYLSTKMIIRF